MLTYSCACSGKACMGAFKDVTVNGGSYKSVTRFDTYGDEAVLRVSNTQHTCDVLFGPWHQTEAVNTGNTSLNP